MGRKTPGVAVNVSPTLRRRQLGRELRAARESRSITRERAAEELDAHISAIYRYENGGVSLKALELRALMDLFEIVAPEDRARLEALRAEGKRRGWWSGYRSALKPSYQTLVGLEDSAIGRRDFASIVVPGLLQTEEYARAVIATALPQLEPVVIESRVKVRLQRQGLITREVDPLRIHVVLDEAAVQRRVGGDGVWIRQLSHLLELATLRNITMQVLPFSVGAFADALGAFTLMDFEEGDPIAYAEMTTGDLYAEGADAQKYLLHFDALKTAALPPPLSVAMIRGLRDDAVR
jgi:transcriptional regulator with XRE-family HTH domain